MLNRREEIDNVTDENQRSLFNAMFEESMGNPISFDAAPELADMESNTWGFNSTNLYVKFKDGTGISIAGVALS